MHGGAYVPESVYPADAVKVVRGDPLTWRLKRSPRFTCRECGTRLFIDVEAKRWYIPPKPGRKKSEKGQINKTAYKRMIDEIVNQKLLSRGKAPPQD